MRVFPTAAMALLLAFAATSCGGSNAAVPQVPQHPSRQGQPVVAADLPLTAPANTVAHIPGNTANAVPVEPAAVPPPIVPPDMWVQTFLSAPLRSGMDQRAQQFQVLPPFSYLHVLEREGAYYYVLNPQTGGTGYVAADRVGPSGPPPPPPPFKPSWVQNFRPVTLWAGMTSSAAFGTLPAWHFFHVIAPSDGPRLAVHVDRTDNLAYVDRADVGPSGPPTAAAPGFLDIASGGRLPQLPGWPDITAQATRSQQIRPGVVLSNVDLLTNVGALHIHQLTVDLLAPGIHVSSVVAHNAVVSTGETISSMANRTGALAGINGDYFAIHDSGVPFNLTVQNGNLIRSGNDWAVFAMAPGNRPSIGKYNWLGSVTVTRDERLQFPIAAVNLPLMDQAIVAVNQSMGSVLAASNATLAYLSLTGTPGRYRVDRVSQHQDVVPPVSGSGVILAGEGVAATWLAQYAPAGAELRLDYQTQPSWQNLQTAVGGGPILIRNGQPYQDSDAPAAFETNQPNPLAGAGVSQDGHTLWLVTVDGREGAASYGLTRPQFAWYFQTIGAWEAMAFDSGGSATLVARLPGQKSAAVVNSPSDGQERPVADGLFIYG